MSEFHNYSFKNTMLIAMKKTDTTLEPTFFKIKEEVMERQGILDMEKDSRSSYG